MSLETEIKTYEREQANLLHSVGKFALIRGEEVFGVFDTFDDALKVGYDKFGLEPFLVKQIEMAQQVHSFTRDLYLCRT